jgi:hypothetical protein
MGRVRYYSADGKSYVSLRVEERSLNIYDVEIPVHKERKRMPLKPKTAGAKGEASSTTAYNLKDPNLLEKILFTFDDFEQVLRSDKKSMVTFKSAYKKPGYQLGVSDGEDWNNVDGQSLLAAILEYHRLLTE